MTTARIMVVEDEPITAEDIHEILRHRGYTVTAVVASGQKALEEAGQSPPDLVVMDIHLKGEMDGVETARLLRERFDVPVVYLTAHADSATLERAKLAEPLGYIVKPFQEAELEAAVQMALHKQQADRQSRAEGRALAAAVEAVGQAVITLDNGGLVRVMNAAAEQWTGVNRAEAAGRPAAQVFRLKAAANPVARALREGVLCEIEEGAVVANAAGEERAVGGMVSPARDHRGEVCGAVIVFGDPSEEGLASLGPSAASADSHFEMIAESPAMKRIAQFALRVAASEASTILLAGDSGTGKDVLAKFIHHHSRRAKDPFLAINCAAIPETLLESELFGFERGAFTDAKAQKKGILEMANGGTVFLDEIAEMPHGLQAKMLRVLEEQSFRRLGGTRDIQVDLRVITATNRDLGVMIEEGRFRLDLFYRLNVIQITVPPLRDRHEDIVPLATHFIRSYNQRYKRNIQGISQATSEVLVAHDWPGNARELRNLIERAMILEETAWIQPASLGLHVAACDSMVPMAAAGSPPPARASIEGLSLADAEQTLLLNALEKTSWNQTHAARELSITRDALRYKMKKYGLKRT